MGIGWYLARVGWGRIEEVWENKRVRGKQGERKREGDRVRRQREVRERGRVGKKRGGTYLK